MRAFFLSVLALAVCTPSANAAPADEIMPVYDAADGVTAGQTEHGTFLRFGPKAAKLYQRFAGHTVRVGCGRPSVTTQGPATFSPDEGTNELRGGGWLSTDRRFPKRRGRVGLRFIGEPYDVCYIATKQRRSDKLCLPFSTFPGDDVCVRLIVALTPQGIADIDRRARVLELGELYGSSLAELRRAFGDEILALESPDASPPIGKVGVYEAGQNQAMIVLLRDGQRLYIRQDGDVYSTNVPEFSGRWDDFSLT